MSDIVKQLRTPPFGTETSERLLMERAAAEIEKLRAALKPFAEKEYAYEGWADIARAEVWLNVRDIRAAAAAIREGGKNE